MENHWFSPPPFENDSNFSDWKKELKIWQALTDLKIEKQGPAIFTYLTGRAKEAVLELDVDQLCSGYGVEAIIERLDKLFSVNKTETAYFVYEKFETFERPEGMIFTDFLFEFEKLYHEIKLHQMVLPDSVLAYRVLQSANLLPEELNLVRTTTSELKYHLVVNQLNLIFKDKVSSRAYDPKFEHNAMQYDPSEVDDFSPIEDHRSAINLMKSEKKYLDALRYQSENDLGDEDRTELILEALEHYEKDSDYESIKNVLGFSNYAFQVAYLKEKEELHFLLEELYKKHGRHEELSRFYTEQKKFLEAAKLARSIDEKVRFMILAGKEFIVNGIQSVGSDLKKMFEDIVDGILSVEDPILKAEAFYFYTYFSKKPTYIMDAFKLFDCEMDSVGKLICLQLLIKQDAVNKSGLFLNTDVLYRNFEETIKAIFRLIEDFHQIIYKEKHSLEKCFEKMGYHLVGSNCTVTDQVNLNFYHNLAGQEKSDQIHRRQITKTQAKATAAKILLNIVRRTISDLRGLVIQQVHVNSVCQMPDQCGNSTCNRLHHPPSRQNLSDALKAIFYDLFISGLCEDAKEKLTKLKTIYSTYLWMNLSPNSLHMLQNLVQSYKPFLHIIKAEQFYEFFSRFRKESKWFFTSIMQQEWNDIVPIKSIDINLYVGLSYISYLIDRKQPLIENLQQIRKEKYHPSNIFDFYNKSLENLYARSNITGFFGATFSILRGSVLEIGIGTLCDLLEVPILLLFTSISATSSPQHPYPFFVPTNYIEHKDLWDILYGTDGFKNAVSRLVRRSLQWEKFAEITKQLCGFLSNLDGVMDEFIEIPEYMKTIPSIVAQLSRMLCLYLVLFSNLRKALYQYGKPLVTFLRKAPSLQGKDFLSTIFNRMRAIKSNEDAKAILVDLLKSRGDTIQYCEWSSKKERLVKLDTNHLPARPDHVLNSALCNEADEDRKDSKDEDQNEIIDEEEDEEDEETDYEDEEIDEDDEDYDKEDNTIELLEDDKDDEEEEENEEINEYEKEEKENEEIDEDDEDEDEEIGENYEDSDEEDFDIDQREEIDKEEEDGDDEEENAGEEIDEEKKEETQEMLSEVINRRQSKYFKKDGRCIVCDFPNAKTRKHVENEFHIENVNLFVKYNSMKEEYEETYDLFANLDVQDNAMEALASRFKRQTFLLRHQKVPFPYNEELRRIVDSFVDRYHILEAEQLKKFREEEFEFESIEGSKRRNLKKRGKK